MFVSLSDNIQETFGLTPVEAMAAGLPVVVTDWDGYRDTVRDGVDGFRIATWAPRAGTGDGLALAHEMGQDHYDMYCGLACQHVAVDPAMLADRLSQLAANATLRRKLGKAGRERARSVFDWSVVYRSYESLWAELDRIRGAAKAEPAPRVAASRLDPFITFGHYPTRQVGPATRVRRRDSSSPETYAALSKLSVYSFAQRVMPGQDLAVAAWNALAAGPVSVAELATVLQIPEGHAIRAAAVFAKVGLVELEA
jgi:alpha-maltose-1-phosphate synthase